MSILITGASGFIGKRLVISACAAFGAEHVVALSSKPGHPCPSIIYDIQGFNLSDDDRAMLENVDVLIHVGAFVPKNALEANAIMECNGNVRFTEKLLALPFKNLKKVLYISTVDVYETASIITETTPTIPASFYGYSKLYCEKMATIFAANHNLVCQVLRVGHVYGPGEEKYYKVLPNAIKNILAGEAVELWGDGSEIRTFIYIDDVVSAILRTITHADSLGPINVVGGEPVSIRELLNKIIAVSGKRVVITPKEFEGTKRDLIFDNAKLRKYLLPVETDLTIGLQAEYAHMADLP